jgi:tetratricopeptide (TPR) repeat protein
MGFLPRLFGKGKAGSATIRAFDTYGRQIEVPRESWRRDVLLPNLEKSKADPDALYGLIVQALKDGFIEEALEPARALTKIDADQLRAHCLHGVVLLQLKRFKDAQTVLEAATAKLGERGYVLTNLAKAYAGRGERVRAEELLWHALELDPNQDNGLGWYATIFQEREGDAGVLAAYQRIAALPGSWRAQLWLARAALARQDLKSAQGLYRETLTKLTEVPSDVLMQISGDLGNQGHLDVLIELCRPYFKARVHGLPVGNNLIKAYVDLKDAESARAILEQLYACQRPDWREHLLFWEKQIDEMAGRYGPTKVSPALEVNLLTLDQPIWAHGVLGFNSLLPVKTATSPRVAFLCGSGDPGVKDGDSVAIEPSTDLGRLTRALPMFLAEELQLRTNARGCFVLPWVKGGGFLLSAKPWGFDDLKAAPLHADFLMTLHIDARVTPWQMRLSLLSGADGAKLTDWELPIDIRDPAAPVMASLNNLLRALSTITAMQVPEDLATPSPQNLAQYLVGIEQALAVSTANIETNSGNLLHAERSIIDNLLLLAVATPASARTRCLLLNTMEKESRRRPDIVREYSDKLRRLQSTHLLRQGATADTVSAGFAMLEAKIIAH